MASTKSAPAKDTKPAAPAETSGKGKSNSGTSDRKSTGGEKKSTGSKSS